MQNQHKRAFFLTCDWTALERMMRGEVNEPEGMPSVYLPWVRYRERGYDVHVFYLSQFEDEGTIEFRGCRIHKVRRSRFFEWRNRQKRLRLRFPADNIFLYRAAKGVAASDGAPTVVYAMQPWLSYAAFVLGWKYGAKVRNRR